MALPASPALTNITPTALTPCSIKGTFTCSSSSLTQTSLSLGLPFPPRGDYYVIIFTPVTSVPVYQGGSLTSAAAANMAAGDYVLLDSNGNLYYFTQLASVVASYVAATQYALNLIPLYV